jgi:hypothetical protein
MKSKKVILALILVIIFVSSVYGAYTLGTKGGLTLEQIYTSIQAREFVDLTHVMAPDIPIGVPKEKGGSGFPCRVYAILPEFESISSLNNLF